MAQQNTTDHLDYLRALGLAMEKRKTQTPTGCTTQAPESWEKAALPARLKADQYHARANAKRKTQAPTSPRPVWWNSTWGCQARYTKPPQATRKTTPRT